MNLHFGGRADRGPVTGADPVEQNGSRGTRRAEAKRRTATPLRRLACSTRNPGPDGDVSGFPKREEAARGAASVLSKGKPVQ